MGVVSDLRILLRDVSVDPDERRYSDAELTVMANHALYELNVRADTIETIATLDAAIATTPTPTQMALYNLTAMLAEIRAIEGEANSPDDFVKFVTQDTTIDPGDAGSRYSKLLSGKRDRFELSFRKQIGGDWGGWAATGPEHEEL